MKKVINTALFLLAASVSLSVAATVEPPVTTNEEGVVDTATGEVNPPDTAEEDEEGEFNAMHCGRGRGGWGGGGFGGGWGGWGGGFGWGGGGCGGGWGHHRRW